MGVQEISQYIADTDLAAELAAWVAGVRERENSSSFQLKSAAGSLPSFLLASAVEAAGGPLVCILPDADDAEYLYSDFQELIGERRTRLVLFPPSGKKPYDREQIVSHEPLIRRTDALQELEEAEAFDGIVVTSVSALFERIPAPEDIERQSLTLAVEDEYGPEDLTAWLVDQDFTRVEFVEEPGEVALRGGIVDVYPFSSRNPVRLDFFGDVIESIREFNPQTQRSISDRGTVRLVPDLSDVSSDGRQYVSLFDYLPARTVLAVFDGAQLVKETDELFDDAVEAHTELLSGSDEVETIPPAERYLDGEELADHLDTRSRIVLGVFSREEGEVVRDCSAQPQPPFNSSVEMLAERLQENYHAGLTSYVLCDSEGQKSRLEDLLQTHGAAEGVELAVNSIHEGFELREYGLAVYTDHQIFNRFHRPRQTGRVSSSDELTVKKLKDLSRGDYVVHFDHGVGQFDGLEKITVRGTQQEAVRLYYAEGDVLYVNINALHKLSKFSSDDGHRPSLTRLGTGQWDRTKERTKEKVKDTARDLIKLYAKRKASDGISYSSDSVWQRELEASFQYEDTPDQARATREVEADMESDMPMDRLICGDVGFGKTEVAVRAAFKAVQDGKQVAMLVPTTILCHQHYETFSNRLERFPVEVDSLSRFRTNAEQKEVIQRLKEGTLDIVIGTHRLVSEDVDFDDLGLLIVDEEQRFGVKTKEKLKELRVNVDTLTLTATPIPRTLQFSLLGVRDLSIINTPPPNRQPIVTEIHTFDEDLIEDAIKYEVSRGGQVFFIHNRVRTIDQIAEMLRDLVPNVDIRVGHGQMNSEKLEDVMNDFMEHEFDVLVCTTIIENGVDIPNANTMIIHQAEQFGLGELHQLRGRVGRSDRKAYCYLLTPSVHTLTRDAKQRLRAVEEFSELGSGFSLAMRDLDIRGAGNLLGAEQSGYIKEVGFETYQRILEEAVRELREEEFAEVFEEDTAAPPVTETTVDVAADAYIPEEYVSNNVERLNLYRRVSEAEHPEQIQDIIDELSDRFGPLPEPVNNLLVAAAIKLELQDYRLARISYKNQRLFLRFPPEEDSYFYDQLFHPLLEQLNALEHEYVLKDTKSGKLRAIVQDVPDLATAQRIAETLEVPEVETATPV